LTGYLVGQAPLKSGIFRSGRAGRNSTCSIEKVHA
jgi:hypothetical protein